jgi:hypothetical protein
LYENRDRLLNSQAESLTQAIALLSDTKRITPGLLSGDEKILRRNIVTPIKAVRKRLRKLPTDPLHYETVLKIVHELQKLQEGFALSSNTKCISFLGSQL